MTVEGHKITFTHNKQPKKGAGGERKQFEGSGADGQVFID